MTRTESGLYYRDLEVGTGRTVQDGRRVGVRYTGWLADGTSFDNNYAHPTAYMFTVGAFHELESPIRGWHEGLVGMQAGGLRQLVIPPSLGYGNRRQGMIPPNSILVFEVRVVGVQ